jgi:hypothetical protein
VESNVNENFSYQAIPDKDSRLLNWKYLELQQLNKPNEKAVRPVKPEFVCQESQLVACQIAPRHAGLCVLAEHTGTTAGSSACCM